MEYNRSKKLIAIKCIAKGIFLLYLLIAKTSIASNLDGMDRESMSKFLSEMPKAELHIHLAGTLSPETIAKLANRNNFDYFNTVEEVNQSLAQRPPGLNGFLQHHNKQRNVLKTQEDFKTAVYQFIKKCHENNIVYVDLSFDPQSHTNRGIKFDDMMKGILNGRSKGQKEFEIEVNLIISINRELSVKSAEKMMRQAKPYKKYILGLGLDSGPEYGNPPSKFKSIYKQAKKDGYYLTIHNDVDIKNSVKHIWEAINILKVDRLDHSLNAVEDMSLIAEINRRKLCLTGSPVQRSNEPEPQDIPRIKFLFQHGVCISLHTDDPEEFASGYLTQMLLNFQQAGKFSKRDMVRLMLNAFKSLWLPEEEKQVYINKLISWAEKEGVSI